MPHKKNINRRQFLKRAAGAAVGTIGFGLDLRAAATFPQGGLSPYIITSSALGKAGSVAPSNRITLGFVGLGQHGTRINLRNFLDCVHTREQPFYPAEVGHRSATVCHLGNISMLLGRKMKWDPENERFLNDEQANKMLSRSMRSPWHL